MSTIIKRWAPLVEGRQQKKQAIIRKPLAALPVRGAASVVGHARGVATARDHMGSAASGMRGAPDHTVAAGHGVVAAADRIAGGPDHTRAVGHGVAGNGAHIQAGADRAVAAPCHAGNGGHESQLSDNFPQDRVRVTRIHQSGALFLPVTPFSAEN